MFIVWPNSAHKSPKNIFDLLQLPNEQNRTAATRTSRFELKLNPNQAIGERRKWGWISSSPRDLPLGRRRQGREGEGGAQGAARRGDTQGQLFIRGRLAVSIEEP
jgi:hypothetical protein